MIESQNIRIYTSEKARYGGKPLSDAVVHYLRGLKLAVRCAVFQGRAGLYESGEISTDSLTDLSYNQPILIDILVPGAEAPAILETLKSMVHEGAIAVLPVTFVSYHVGRGHLPARLLVRDLMATSVVQAHLDFTVRTVVELLLDRKLKALPVVDADGVPVGIVTTENLLAAGMPVRTGLFSELSPAVRLAFLARAEAIPVTKIMTAAPVVVAEGVRASHAVHLMVEKGLKRLPVVDAQGVLVGMIARIDLLRAVSSEVPHPTEGSPPAPGATPRSVRDISRRNSQPVRMDASLFEAVDLVVKQGEPQVAVVDRDGKLVGMVGDRELFGVLDEGGLVNAIRRLFFPGHHRREPVSQVMRHDVARIDQDATLDEALLAMVENGLKRLPVVDGSGRFLGMVRRDALLSALSHDL